MSKPKPDFLAILQTLAHHKVEFIVVGGVCAVLQGAPISTFDLDLVHSRATDNLKCLLCALEALDAHYRGQGARRRLKPGLSHLASPGHQLLMTSAGPLDLLGEIGEGHDYTELLGVTEELPLGTGLKVRVLKLEALIKIKEETIREKDKAILIILRRTLQEKSKKS